MTMRTIATSVLAALVFVSAAAYAQPKAGSQPSAQPKINCNVPRAPQKVEGQITRVDPATNTITVRESNGGTHEFQASRETLQDLKVGDRIEATLRPAQNC
jgi:hypothetical protein